jgi:copper transport protein
MNIRIRDIRSALVHCALFAGLFLCAFPNTVSAEQVKLVPLKSFLHTHFSDPASLTKLTLDANTSNVHDHASDSHFSISKVTQYIAKGIWYSFSLGLIGGLLWLRWVPESIRTNLYYYKSLLLQLQRGQLMALLLMIFTSMKDLFATNDINDLASLFSFDGIGLSWALLMGLSFLGFIVLQRNLYFDLLWILMFVISKNLSSYKEELDLTSSILLMNGIHFIAASLLVGGLIVVWLCWRRQEADFMVVFNRVTWIAVIAIATLMVTGIVTIGLYLPDIRYITYTIWGNLMLIKFAIVIVAIVLATWIYVSFRKKRYVTIGRLLPSKLVVVFLTLLLVGCMIHFSPLPPNEKFRWHVMGDRVHMSAEISPRQPGRNTFIVKVWLNEKWGPPKQVSMVLHTINQKKIEAISVPMMQIEDNMIEEDFGLKKFSYRAEGAYLPDRGKYQLEIRILDQGSQETVYQRELIVY